MIHKKSKSTLNAGNFDVDPLYETFEKMMHDFNDATETQDAFIDKVLVEYLKVISAQGLIVSPKYRVFLEDEVREQVQVMLVKKSLGCLKKEEFLVPPHASKILQPLTTDPEELTMDVKRKRFEFFSRKRNKSSP